MSNWLFSEPPVYLSDLALSRAMLATLQHEFSKLTEIAVKDQIGSAVGLPPFARLPAVRGESATEREFAYTPCFRSVRLDDQQWTLTANQAEVIRTLYIAWINGTPDVSSAYLLESLGDQGFAFSKLKDVFKHDPEIWRILAMPGRKRGTVRLNLTVSNR